VTATTPDEARVAHAAGADAVIVQGVEAGGHRGGFDDAAPGEFGLLALLQLVRASLDDPFPIVATGGIANGGAVAAVLAAGAAAAQLGTAFMLCAEAADGACASRRDRARRRADRPDAGVHRSYRARDGQPLSQRAFGECAERVP
jgi:nitronate monooxygenase